VLRSCDERSQHEFPHRTAFFVGATGNVVTSSSVGVHFRRAWDLAGLPWAGHGTRPRPYDFRHHFAYANIERWAATGTDATAMLPYLAAYMGHASVDSTLYYVHTSPDFLDSYARIVNDMDASLLPEAGF